VWTHIGATDGLYDETQLRMPYTVHERETDRDRQTQTEPVCRSVIRDACALRRRLRSVFFCEAQIISCYPERQMATQVLALQSDIVLGTQRYVERETYTETERGADKQQSR